MKIGELAKKSGLSAHTLRFYEKSGLLRATTRTQSNYRLYSQGDLDTAVFIRRAREIGFSLEEVGVFLSIRSDLSAHVCAEAKSLADRKIEEVTHKRDQLTQMLSALNKLSNACCGGSESAEYCTIIEALDQPQDH